MIWTVLTTTDWILRQLETTIYADKNVFEIRYQSTGLKKWGTSDIINQVHRIVWAPEKHMEYQEWIFTIKI